MSFTLFVCFLLLSPDLNFSHFLLRFTSNFRSTYLYLSLIFSLSPRVVSGYFLSILKAMSVSIFVITFFDCSNSNFTNFSSASLGESKKGRNGNSKIYILSTVVEIQSFVWKQNMNSFSNETLNFFFKKFWASYILDLSKNVRALQILSQKSTRNFGIKIFCALENYVLVNRLLCSSHFIEVY